MEISSEKAAGSKNQEMNLRYKVPEFMIVIDKLYRQLTWLLGQTAYRMIKV